jgi:hypothetical protein
VKPLTRGYGPQIHGLSALCLNWFVEPPEKTHRLNREKISGVTLEKKFWLNLPKRISGVTPKKFLA